MVAELDDKGVLVKDGAVTPDGYAVNTLLPLHGPLPAKYPIPNGCCLFKTAPTIGDRLNEKGIDWAWYSGGWDDALWRASRVRCSSSTISPSPTSPTTRCGTPGAKAHLKDEADFVDAIEKGTLPPVSFFKPIGEDNEHPGYASVLAGEHHTALLIDLIETQPALEGQRRHRHL